MANLRSEASPLGERFNLETVIQGIADDIGELRRGRITVEDAKVRAELAKQFMNGVRLVIHAQKYLEERAKIAAIGSASPRPRTEGGQ